MFWVHHRAWSLPDRIEKGDSAHGVAVRFGGCCPVWRQPEALNVKLCSLRNRYLSVGCESLGLCAQTMCITELLRTQSHNITYRHLAEVWLSL